MTELPIVLPPLQAYLDKCGKGTAWIGSMIAEQMQAYARAAIAADRAARKDAPSECRDVLNRADAWLNEADKRGINMTDDDGYLAVIRDLVNEVRRLGALVPSNAIAWQERVVQVEKTMRAYRILRLAVDAMMAPLVYHGTISARDDRVQAVMDALAQVDKEDR